MLKPSCHHHTSSLLLCKLSWGLEYLLEPRQKIIQGSQHPEGHTGRSTSSDGQAASGLLFGRSTCAATADSDRTVVDTMHQRASLEL